MKKTLTLLAWILIINVNAQTNIDSLKDVAFKSIVNNYIEDIENTLTLLKNATEKDSIKKLATHLIECSGKLESDADKFYGHEPTSIQYGLVLSENVSYEPILITGNKKPKVSSYAICIHDISCGIYWLYNKNPEKLDVRISKIESILLIMKEKYELK